MSTTPKKVSRISLDTDKVLHKKIKMRAIKEGKTIKSFLTQILKEYFDRKEQ